MGASFGSVQIRSEDRDKIKVAAEQVAAAMKIKMLIGPALSGWIGIYPENNGQDERVGLELAKLLDGYVLQILLHDDDVFAYWLHLDGKPIDSYWSTPGYFGPKNLAAEHKMVGQPEMFRPLIGDRIDRLAKILDRAEPQPVFKSDKLEAFATLLKIPNALQAYEYLKEEGIPRPKGWRQFKEIPATQVEDERAKTKREKARTKEDRQRFKTDGLLLLREERKGVTASASVIRSGFLVGWEDYRAQARELSVYNEPWGKPMPIDLGGHERIGYAVSNYQGTRLALAARDRVQVFDVTGEVWKPAADMQIPSDMMGLSLSADGGRIAVVSRDEITISEVGTAEPLLTLPTQSHRGVCFHPTEQWAVASGNSLRMMALGPSAHWFELFPGGKLALVEALRQKQRLNYAALDIEAMMGQQRAGTEAAFERLQKMAAKSKKNLGYSEEGIQRAREIAEKQLEEQKLKWIALKEGRIDPTPPQAVYAPRSVGFTGDGRWLWCVTDYGLRIYEWAKVPRESGLDLPQPTWRFVIPHNIANQISNRVSAVANELGDGGLLFVHSGRLLRLDLASGNIRPLLKFPGNAEVYELHMSVNGKALGLVTNELPGPTGGRAGWNMTRAWEIWSYPQLLENPWQPDPLPPTEPDPPSAAALYRHARLKFSGDLQGALVDLNKAIELNPNLAGAYSTRGSIKLKTGDLDSALLDFAKAIELEPDTATHHSNRGDVRRLKGDLDGALVDYNRAIELDAADAPTWNNRGFTKQKLGDLTGAMADFDRAIEIDPGMDVAFRNRGDLQRARKKFRLALDDYDVALRLEPRKAQVLRARGLTKHVLGDLDGATADFNRCLDLDPRDATALNNRGLVKKDAGDLSGALADFDQAIALKPDSAALYANRGVARKAMGLIEDALADFDKAIELNPNNALAHHGRGQIRFKAGDFRDALADMNEVLEQQPENAIALSDRALAKRGIGDLQEALADSERAVTLDPKNPRVLNNRALVKTSWGNFHEALADFDKAIGLKPNAATLEHIMKCREEMLQKRDGSQGGSGPPLGQ